MAKDENKKVKKEKKNNLKSFRAELKKVVWPTPKQLANNTIAVITIVLITTAIVFVLDFAFEKINEYGIEKLKSTVESRNETDSVELLDENTTIDNNGDLTEDNSEEATIEGETSEEQNSDNQVVE